MSSLTEKITSLENLVQEQTEKIQELTKLLENQNNSQNTQTTKCAACNYIKETDEKCPCCWGI